MPRKSGIPNNEVTKLLAIIKNAEKVRDDFDDQFQYTNCHKLYKGDFKSVMPTWLTGTEMIPINEPYAYSKTFIPSIYSRDPYLTCIPKGKKWIIGAKILELAINAYWRRLRLKRQVRQCLFDAIFCEGWMKLGYSASLGKFEKEDGDKTIFPSEYIQKDEIFATRVSWKNMVRDPDSVDGVHDARFLAQKMILPLEAVKATSYYESTDDIRPNYVVPVSGPLTFKGTSPEYKTEQAYVVLWEMWNADEQKVYTVAEGHADFLMNKKWPYKFNGYPYEMIRFNECFDEPYAPNLIAPWLPQLWEKMKIRAMELDHLKRFGRQYIMEKGTLDKLNKDKMKKGYTGSVIEKEPNKPDPTPIPYPPIQTDMYGVENRVDMDKDNISGQPNTVRSAPQKTTSRTLGEIDRMISAFQSRQNDPQSVVEDFSEEVAKKLANLMQQYFSGEDYIRASGIDMQFLQREMKDNPMSDRLDSNGFLMRKEDIKDVDFEIEVRAGSTLPLDRKNRVSSMVSIIELGEKIGIMEGDKVSRVIGKNLLADFEMPEIIQAYEDTLQRLEAQEATAMIGAVAQQRLAQKHMGQIAQAHRQSVARAHAGGAPPPTPPNLIPPDLLK